MKHIFAILFLITIHCFFASGISFPADQSALAPDSNPKDSTRTIFTSDPWQKYEDGGEGAMAVLITDSDCSWLALAHGLKTIGIPFFITRDFQKALEHPVVMIYPSITGNLISTRHFFNLRDYVREGGTLIGIMVDGQSMQEIFGYEVSEDVSDVNYVIFDQTNFKFDELKYAEDKTIVVHNPKSEEKSIGTMRYKRIENFPIAHFDDGSAAIIWNKYGKGKAYAFGIDIGWFLARGYNGKQTDLARSYVNKYEPTLDIMLRMVREIYREAGGITLATAPDGKHLNVIFTHDIDYNHSVKNSLVYAQYEKSKNISATYFMQTKYIKDWEDEIFFTPENEEVLRQIKDMNMEIASHSVSHSKSYKFFELGTGKESFPYYTPFIQTEMKTIYGTVLGEMRVSKRLLDSTIQVNVVSFRPGNLSVPKTLPQSLLREGYKYSSCMTANDAITHFPFQLSYNRDDSVEVPIFEFPIAIEDEEGKLGDRLPQALKLAEKISNEDGLMVILIHPNVLDHKLAFEKGFVEKEINQASFTNLKEFGNWWSARNDVKVDFKGNHIFLDSPQLISGLTLLLPNGKTLVVPLLKGHMELTY